MSNLLVERCDFRIGDNINGIYTVDKILGEGAFGKVYKVHGSDGQPHALKLLRLWEMTPDTRTAMAQRFEMEYRTGLIDCDNLVRAEQYGSVGGNPYIVMEFCGGGDLTPLLGKAGNQAATICYQILTGMKALHQNGKVHRDLKPENVLFKNSGVAALTDFGISGDRNHRMTQRNIFGKPDQIFGTYAYMAPEQANRARGNATVLPTTDIFSFGAMAFQLLTGLLPFGTMENYNELAVYQKRSKNGDWDLAPLSQLPEGAEWKRLIEGCLVPDFKRRLQTADDVIAMLPKATLRPEALAPAQPQRPAAPQQPTGPQRATLRVMQGEEYGHVYDLDALTAGPRRIITVGRVAEGNDLQVKDEQNAYVSRHHCTLERRDGAYLIRDGQWRREEGRWAPSQNGTYVGSTEVTQTGLELHPGDIITLGDTTLKFEQ